MIQHKPIQILKEKEVEESIEKISNKITNLPDSLLLFELNLLTKYQKNLVEFQTNLIDFVHD
jgi:hypothetical protein